MSADILQLAAQRHAQRNWDEAQELGRALNVASINTWIGNVSGLVDICFKEHRWHEATFWGHALAGLLEVRLEIENGANARKEVSYYEDRLCDQSKRLRRLIDRDEANIANEDPMQRPMRRSQNSINAERRCCMRSF